MGASVIINQATRPAGTAGKSRNDGVVSQLVTCTNNTVEGSYLWTLVDVPIRSALTRGTTGSAASFTFTPDVKGTYLITLKVNGSSAPSDNQEIFISVPSSLRGWRYQGASETTSDNLTYVGLGFPSNVNPRGWATNEDIVWEEVENSVNDTVNAIITYSGLVSRLVKTDPSTGKISATLIPAISPTGPVGGDLSGSMPNPQVVGLRGLSIQTPLVPSDNYGLIWKSTASQWVAAPPVAIGTAGILQINAGTTNASSGTVVFSNSPTVTFGMNAGTITASAVGGGGGGGNLTISAGTASMSNGSLVLSNSNGISFGLNGSTITASYTVPSTAGHISAINLSAGTTSNNLTAFTLSNSNNVSFGLNGSVVTATASYSQSTAPAALSAGTTQATNGTVVLSNSNGISFGMNAGTITASYTVPSTAGHISAINLSAGTTSNNLTAFTLSNSNNVSFGLNGSVVTGSIPSGATATGNFGALAAGTQTATSGTVAFSNSNGISFGMSGSNQITASYTVPSTAGLISAVNLSAGTTSNNLSAFTLSNSNNVSFGLNGSVVTATASYSQSTAPAAISAGTTQATNGTVVFSNSNGVSFGMNNGTITATVVPGAAAGVAAISFPGAGANTAYTSGTVTFADFGNVAQWTTNAGSVAVVPYIRVSGNGTSTYAHSVTFTDANNFSWLMSTTTDGRVTIGASFDPPFDGIAVVGSTLTSGIPVFSNSNNITFGMNGSTITASYQDLDVAISAGTASISSGTVVFSNSNGMSFGLNGSTLTASFDDPGLSMLSTYEPYPIHNTGTAGLSWATNTSAPMTLIPFQVVHEVAADYLRMIVSMSVVTGGTSSYNQSGTLQWGIYTRNVSSLSLSTSSSADYYMSYNNSSVTFVYPSSTKAGAGGYNTATTNSAGLNLSSQFTGLKLWENVLYTTLTPGYYWLGLHHRNSSSSFNSGLRMSFLGNAFSLTNLAPMGQLSSRYSTGTGLYGAQGQHMLIGSYSVNAMTALTDVVSISQITANVTIVPYMMYASGNIV